MNPRTILTHAAKLAVSYLVLLFILMVWGQDYARFLLPFFQWIIDTLAPHYYSVVVMQGAPHGEPLIALNVTTGRYVPLGHSFIPPGISLTSTTLSGHMLQHVLVMASLLLAWPIRRWHDYVSRLGMGIPFLLTVEGLDIPLVLLGSLDDFLLAKFSPATAGHTFTVYWMNFLNGGGRIALSIAAAAVTLATHQLLFSNRTQAYDYRVTRPR